MKNGNHAVIKSISGELPNFIRDNNDIRDDIIRTNNSRFIEFPDSEGNTDGNYKELYDSNQVEINSSIYRYKFTEEFTNQLYEFSKIHQYDHRKDFKESWNIWVEENNEIVNEESKRLTETGYDGDILEKMFKSARYYFRKKSTEKKTPQKRRDYIEKDQEFLRSIDNHILLNISHDDYKPSTAFELFCKENIELLKKEIKRLCNSGLSDSSEIRTKVKKTYKNRYFMIINKKLSV
jgi:hypothetical protein